MWKVSITMAYSGDEDEDDDDDDDDDEQQQQYEWRRRMVNLIISFDVRSQESEKYS